MIECCPHCRSANFELNGPGGFSGPTTEATKRYRCRDCSEHFNEPDERKELSTRNAGRSGLSKKLMEADPEDWP